MEKLFSGRNIWIIYTSQTFQHRKVFVTSETQRTNMKTIWKLSLSLSILLKLSESCEILQKGDTLCSTGLNATLTALSNNLQCWELENYLHECVMLRSVAVSLIRQRLPRLWMGPQALPAVTKGENSTLPIILHLSLNTSDLWEQCWKLVNFEMSNNPFWSCWRLGVSLSLLTHTHTHGVDETRDWKTLEARAT